MILFLLLAYSFVILLRTDGPFNIILKLRNRLFALEQFGLGHFFYKLLDCPYCIGFWCSLVSALIIFPVGWFTIVWAFIGAVCVYIAEHILLAIQAVIEK